MICPGCKKEMSKEETYKPQHKQGVEICKECYRKILDKKFKK